jgi:hypothetical protein
MLRDAQVALMAIFGVFAGVAAFSVLLVLVIRPVHERQLQGGGGS